MSETTEPATAERGQALTVEAHAELLRLARRVAVAGSNAETARHELHAAIRKAHRGGATIASIAVAAGLSTTRTHVIATKGKDNQ